jgi:hypothetical protein
MYLSIGGFRKKKGDACLFLETIQDRDWRRILEKLRFVVVIKTSLTDAILGPNPLYSRDFLIPK